MENINSYKKLDSKIEKILEKITLKNTILSYDINFINESAERKINRFIRKEEQKLYQIRFSLLDIEEEVNKRLPSAMRKYNVRDYWKRREAIQKWRVTAYSEEAYQIFQTKMQDLDEKKTIKEKEVKEKIFKNLRPFIVSDEERESKEIQYNEALDVSNHRIAEYKRQIESEKEIKIAKKTQKNTNQVNRLNLKLNELKMKRNAIKIDKYILPKDVVLKVENLTMQFGGLKAVDNLSFEVKKGEIFGLIGPNGAGKTTVFNCITQFYNPTKGELYFLEKSGSTISLNDYVVHDVIKKGIVRTFQNVELVKEVSVLDNLLIAAHTQYKSSFLDQMLHLPILKKEELAIRKKAEQILEFMGLSLYKNWLAFGLPYGVLKKIEIARTLMNNPQLIILDEPAAGLNDTETAELTKLIRKIQEKYDCTILLVEHDMGLVMDICDTVCAISFGKLLAIGTTEEIQANKDVQAAYLGYDEE